MHPRRNHQKARTAVIKPSIDNAADAVDSLLSRATRYAVPAIIVAASLAVLLSQESLYSAADPEPLTIQVTAEDETALSPQSALSAALAEPPTEGFSTNRSSEPHWVHVRLPQHASAQHSLELPSRHARQLHCWDAASLHPIGEASHISTAGAMRKVKAGFTIDLAMAADSTALLCRIVSSGPARISAQLWLTTALAESEHDFKRSVWLLEGGLLTLAVFMLVLAVINRDWRYLLLGVWVICNLRLAALSLGWDMQWLGFALPPQHMELIRKVTIAVYLLVIYSLFSQVFRDDLRKIDGDSWLLLPGQLASIVLLPLAVALPFAVFLPVMWVVALFTVAVMMLLLIQLLVRAWSRMALYYSLAVLVVLIASFSEVLAAAIGAQFLFTAFNNVSAAFISSLLVAFALAEQVRTERLERLEAQRALRRTYESTPVGLFTLDADGYFLRSNPTLQRMFSMPAGNGTVKQWEDYFEPETWPVLLRTAEGSDGGEIELHGIGGDAGTGPWYLIKAIKRDGRIEGSLQDITERVLATERLRFLAEHDSLTGALNRRGIEQALEQAIDDAAHGLSMSMAYLDLDRFKLINELFGNRIGDQVLIQVCQRITRALGADASLGRLGGNEFVIVLKDAPVVAASRICQRLIDAISTSPYRIDSHVLQVRLSAGLIDLAASHSAATAISAAERACKEAKKSPTSGHLVVYERDAPVFSEHEAERQLMRKLGTWDVAPDMHLVMQPIMSLRQPEDSLNFEVLLRMRGSDGSETPVSRVLAAAEASGNMPRVDRWVLDTTLRWLSANLRRLPKTRFVTVNISGSSLNDEDFVESVFALLAQHESLIPILCLEITESVALQDLAYTRRFMDRLQERGVRFALDDFGAGYTSFSYLRHLPAEALKIDGSLIRNITQHPANIAIVAAIVDLARNLGMRSIAEWAEDHDTIEALVEIGVDYVQGYAIARPQSPAAILGAASGASFIDDPEVASLVARLSENTGTNTQ